VTDHHDVVIVGTGAGAAINLDYQLDHGAGSLPYAPP
jgi:hypothetical protein